MKQESNILYIQIHKKKTQANISARGKIVFTIIYRGLENLFLFKCNFIMFFLNIFSHFEQVHIFYLTNLSIC